MLEGFTVKAGTEHSHPRGKNGANNNQKAKELTMEAIKCIHKEKITTSHGVDNGFCSKCGQGVRYPLDKLQEKPTVYKLGRIGDRLVLPNPSYNLLLGFQDTDDLAAAQKAELERHISQPEKSLYHLPPTAATGGDQVTPVVPPRPKKRDQLPKYYEDNKEAILLDYRKLKLVEFFKRWSISTVKWLKLKRQWGVQNKQPQKATVQLKHQGPPSPGQTAAALEKARTGQLPPLPPWSDNWAPEVQVRWLDIYEKLIAKRNVVDG